MVEVFLEVSYGQSFWLWKYPHTKHSLLLDWRARRNPFDGKFDGVIGQISAPINVASLCDAYIHYTTHRLQDCILDLDGLVMSRKE